MILKLSNKEHSYNFNVDDLNNGEKLYFKFQIPTLNVEDGKYNMVLLDNDVIIAEEQVCIGNFNAETIQYSRGENVYINSPLDTNLEDVRTITIDVPNYTIYPSEGYDAMKEVVVDAQPVYDNGYNEGETVQKAKLTGITITENGTYSREDGYNEITVDVPDLNGDYSEGYDAGKVDGYDSGYTAGIDYASENAEEIAAANAIDLVATKFGTYYTKYSDNIVINNDPIILDNLIKSVDVQPKINVEQYGIKFGKSTFIELPDFYDFSNVTDMSFMFSECGSLQTIPLINTSIVVRMNNMFESCSSLQTLPELNTSNVISMGSMFKKYGGIQTLTSLPKFNVPKLTDIGGYFYLNQVTLNNLTEVGGWENLKCNWNDNGGLVCLPNLTYQSCINILNGLYDFTGNGETPNSSQGKLKVHPNFLTTVGDEISIGTSKGWTISAN